MPAAAAETTVIGFVGLGTMGSRIAGRMLASGCAVAGTNRTASKAAALVDRGLLWRETPREVAEASTVIFSMVADDAALDAVTAGPDGILAGLAPEKVYVDMSTVAPQTSRELAARVRARGAEMLDAPVSGSVPAAEEGSLTIMVGGNEEAFERVAPLLRELGRTVTHVGANGQGLLLKLAINISIVVQMLAFSEGVLLAERGGIDPRLALDVMTDSAIASPMLKARAPLIRDLPAEPWFDVQMMQKDIRLALEASRTLDVPMPTAAVADELLTAARALGYSRRDIAALFDVLAQMHGASAPAGSRHDG
jgi:3-hydroxyisobutyrate dehydrogenase-like beta-hydroxyacid dehydrogenase